MKRLLYVSAILCATATAQAQKTKPVTKPAAKPASTKSVATPMKNLTDSFSYAAGLNIAASMKEQGITGLNTSLVARAIQDVMDNKKPLLTPEQANMCLQDKLQEYEQKKTGAERAKGDAYLAANKKRAGVTSLPNGLQYEVIKPGDASAPKATPNDTVVVHYAGSLIDGTEFDNSIKRGEPATFPVGGVIRGWTEILQLMPKGAEWKVYIPSELGYGDRGAGAAIPPGATLVFDINLLDIKPAVK